MSPSLTRAVDGSASRAELLVLAMNQEAALHFACSMLVAGGRARWLLGFCREPGRTTAIAMVGDVLEEALQHERDGNADVREVGHGGDLQRVGGGGSMPSTVGAASPDSASDSPGNGL